MQRGKNGWEEKTQKQSESRKVSSVSRAYLGKDVDDVHVLILEWKREGMMHGDSDDNSGKSPRWGNVRDLSGSGRECPGELAGRDSGAGIRSGNVHGDFQGEGFLEDGICLRACLVPG